MKFVVKQANLFAEIMSTKYVCITMSTQVKKKHAPKRVRLGWAPLKDFKSVKLTLDLVKGEKVTACHLMNENPSNPGNSYLIP